MKTYVANRPQQDRNVKVVSTDRSYFLDPAPSQKLRNHSPDGFEWGYGGSGPAQLALAILLDLLGDGARHFIENVYQDFKFEIIAKQSPEGFVLTEEQIRHWLADHAPLCAS